MLRKVFDEQVRPEPVEEFPAFLAEKPIGVGGLSGKRIKSGCLIIRVVAAVVIPSKERAGGLGIVIGVVGARVEQHGILRAHWKRQAVFQRVQADKVAKNVAAR